MQPGRASFVGTLMSVKAGSYRVRADECDRRAAVTFDLDLRTLYHEVAAQWRAVAEQAEQLDTLGE
jgi:hypothetical protein